MICNLKHQPVLVQEVVSSLACRPGGVYVDCTVGEGGHAARILEQSAPDGRVIGLDVDGDVLAIAKNRLSAFAGRYRLIRENYKKLTDIMAPLDVESVSGILVDLGISSFQLDSSTRGFSFAVDAPLDMRMDQRLTVTAADLVNNLNEKDLANLLWQYGEEASSRRIARAIVSYREQKRIVATTELKEIVLDAVPSNKKRRIHPATKTFQALRIAINGELEDLDSFILNAVNRLETGGRLVMISFHSLEDRIVKQTFKRLSSDCVCPPGFPVCRCDHQKRVTLITKKPIVPGEDEIRDNFRSRSARLRAVEKI